MKTWLSILSVVCLSAALAAAQQSPAPKPAPGGTDGILGPQLIAWSELQKPQPVPQQPQPVPPPDTEPAQQPSQQNPPSDAQPPAHSETPDSTSQTVTGSIAKVAGKYMLQTADNVSYQLDDQEKAKRYEGKRVRVTGSLDRTTGIFHVSSMELLS